MKERDDVMLTPEQARAATAPGSVAVVAGAGTGKTHMLAHRYLYHLKQGFSPLEVVATTFTERAAAELRARIRTEVASDLPNRPEILAELEAAQIGTLHSLAARICRDHPEAANVPPDFTVTDDVESAVSFAEQFTVALAALPTRLFEMIPYSLLKTTLEALLESPLLAEAALNCDWDRWPELIEAARAKALSDLTTRSTWQDARVTVEGHQGAEDDKLEVARQHALRALKALDEGDGEGAAEAFTAVNLQGGKKANWPDIEVFAIKSVLKTLREDIKEAAKSGLLALRLGPVDDDLRAMLPAVREAFSLLQGHLREVKHRDRKLDFSDLETHALKALESASVRAHYRKRWRAFLVDEFQDTNPVQADLLAKLCEGATLTLVGDEKQAIYGFRGAEASIFRDFRRTVTTSGGEEVPLTLSFRTHAALLTTVNELFKSAQGDTYQALTAHRTSAPHSAPHAEGFVVSLPDDVKATKPFRQVTEARALGKRIRHLIDAEVPVFDKALKAHRPVRAGDIAVLTRTWKALDVYSEVFPAVGVPALHAGGGSLLDTREAKDGYALLRFLADPSDEIALFAVLRSPHFAVDDATLFELSRSKSGDISWWDAVQSSNKALLERAKDVLSDLIALNLLESPSRLLQFADRETGYSAVLSNLPGAQRRMADWRGFTNLVRTLEVGLGDVFSVVRKLRRLVQAEAKVPRPPLQGLDAVSLMTIHGAKGLEWPVVVVADLDYRPGNQLPHALFDPQVGLGLKLDDEAGLRQETALYTLLKHRRQQAEQEELVRLIYVALTRARDRLILSATEARGDAYHLLSEGLDRLGISLDVVVYDPRTATYPTPPTPNAGSEMPLLLLEAVTAG